MKKYLTRCSCGGLTTKSYARAHAGKCKTCVEPDKVKATRTSAAARADEAFREDHMGCSEDAYDNRHGSSGDY